MEERLRASLRIWLLGSSIQQFLGWSSVQILVTHHRLQHFLRNAMHHKYISQIVVDGGCCHWNFDPGRNRTIKNSAPTPSQPALMKGITSNSLDCLATHEDGWQNQVELTKNPQDFSDPRKKPLKRGFKTLERRQIGGVWVYCLRVGAKEYTGEYGMISQNEWAPKILGNGWDTPVCRNCTSTYNPIISHWSCQMMLWYLFLPSWGCNEKHHTYNPKHQQTFPDKSKPCGFQLLSPTSNAIVVLYLLLPETSFSVSLIFNDHHRPRAKTPCAHWYGGWTKSKSPAPKDNSEETCWGSVPLGNVDGTWHPKLIVSHQKISSHVFFGKGLSLIFTFYCYSERMKTSDNPWRFFTSSNVVFWNKQGRTWHTWFAIHPSWICWHQHAYFMAQRGLNMSKLV